MFHHFNALVCLVVSSLSSILTLSHTSSFCHTSLSLNLVKSLPPTILSLSLLSSFHFGVFLCSLHTYSMYVCFLTKCPVLPLSCPPLSICPSVLWWNELMCQLGWSSLQLLSANCNSISLMCRCLSPPHTHTHLSLSLSPPLCSLPSFTLSCLVFSVSLSLHPSHVGSHRLFYFPLRLACQEDSTPCPAVWCCSVCVHLCMCAFCTLLWVSVSTCVCRSGEQCERALASQSTAPGVTAAVSFCFRSCQICL